MELCRIFLVATPLGKNDVRLKLMEQIRETVVREDRPSGLRWLVLNTLQLYRR